jgi:hypothetical protein
METWMLVVGVAVIALPFLLMAAFNAGIRADSSGRRLRHDWRVPKQKI